MARIRVLFFRMIHARHRALIPLLFILVSLGGYGVLLLPKTVPYSPHSDVVTSHLATKQVLHRSLAQGLGIPYWRSDELSGTPAFTCPNALYTNPLHLAFFVADPERAAGWTFFVQLLAAALGCYLTGRALKLGRSACVFLAISGLFSFKLILAVYAGWLGPLAGIVSVPFLFAAAFNLVRKPTLGPALALTASGILCLHGGQLQIPFYAVGFAGAYFLSAILASWRMGRGAEARRLFGWVLGAGMLATAATLYLLLPMASEAREMSRSQASALFLQSGHRLGARHLLTLLWPEALGTPLDGSYPGAEIWEDNAYFGLLPLLLVGVGATLGWRRSTTRFLLAGFLLSLLFAFDTPLLSLLYGLPLFSLFRSPARMLFLTAYFGTVLAGVGVEELLHRLRRQGSRLAEIVAVLFVILAAGEGAIYAHRYLAAKPLAFFQPVTRTAQLLTQDASLFRVAPVGRSTFSYGSAASQGLQLITGYEPYNLRRYRQYMDLVQFGQIRFDDAVVWTDLTQVTRWDLFDDLNVKYLLSSRPLSLPQDRFELLATFKHEPVFVFYRGMRETDVLVYRNRQARPRAYFAGPILAVPDLASAQAALSQRSVRSVTIVENPDGARPSTAVSAEDRLLVLGAADGSLDLSYHSGGERFLVVSEIWHPGWRATLDGRPISLYPTNLSLLGTWLPGGEHRVSLVFRPSHFAAGSAVSLCALLVLLCALLWVLNRKGASKEAWKPGSDGMAVGRR